MTEYNYILKIPYISDTSNEESDKMLRHLELIDDEASQYDVKLVKIDDPLMAKKYGHRDPPGLGYFRKGNYVKYDGAIIFQKFIYFHNKKSKSALQCIIFYSLLNFRGRV